ncbi:hypothetical protein SAMN05216323_107410 [Williamwhitmania taraxaci]|uniref:Uncharacterized protein n=1 Tax=Williamwhitmania taraxaci TaxID=1640674 RepID=A0A1G6RGG1_9BACT|nr:hypothetical protein SAMN05216323_107410 [Williamwhitmania taraxaci]
MPKSLGKSMAILLVLRNNSASHTGYFRTTRRNYAASNNLFLAPSSNFEDFKAIHSSLDTYKQAS